MPLLSQAREYNARLVWETVKTGPAKRRRVEGLLQREGGRRAAWEDPVVSYIGIFWRRQRGNMTSHQWRQQVQDFVATTCKRWDIPTCCGGILVGPVTKRARTAQQGAEKDKLVFRREEPEADELMDTIASKVSWDAPAKRFLYAADSQLLHQVVCGHSTLHESNYGLLFTRVLNRIVGHMTHGWRPPQLHEDPVQWWRRCHNKVADGLADLTMDRRTTWRKQFDTTLDAMKSNIVVQTDGGLREDDCAAAAWIIGLWGTVDGKDVFEPFIIHGTFLELPCTAFGAEAIALDEASAEVAMLRS